MRDQLLLLGLAAGVVVVPGHLDLHVVGFRSGRAEQQLRCLARRELFQRFGQFDGQVVRLAGKDVGVGQPLHLLGGNVDNFLVAIAQRRAPQARQALDVLLALVVVDVDALAFLDHRRAGLAERRQVGVGVDQGFDVPHGEVGKGLVHFANTF
jgi:hypothetical protein